MCLDNIDRLEVEQFISRNMYGYVMRCIAIGTEETQSTSINLSVFVSNLFRIQMQIILAYIWLCHRYAVYASECEAVIA